MKRVGNRLKRARKRAGLSQGETATQALVSQPLLSECENGNRPLYPALRKRLAKILAIDESELE